MSNDTPETPTIQILLVPIDKGIFTVVSDCDADLARFSWRIDIGTSTTYARIRSAELGKTKIHRIILGRMLGRKILPHEEVDHANGDGLDNRRENLRLATHAQNMQNRGTFKNNTSGYKGVSWNKQQRKWVAYICKEGINRTIGRFTDPVDAAKAYDAEAKRLHGEFARLNFPDNKD